MTKEIELVEVSPGKFEPKGSRCNVWRKEETHGQNKREPFFSEHAGQTLFAIVFASLFGVWLQSIIQKPISDTVDAIRAIVEGLALTH